MSYLQCFLVLFHCNVFFSADHAERAEALKPGLQNDPVLWGGQTNRNWQIH